MPRAPGARQCERARDAQRRQRAARQRPAGRAGNPCRRSAERRLRRGQPWRFGARAKKAWRRGSRRAMATGSSPTCCRSPTGIRRQAGASYAAVAAVFVQKAGQDASPAVQTLAEQYDLTAGRAARPGRAHRFRRRRRGRGGAEAVTRDRAHASAPCVREDRRAAPGRSHQADGELSGADPGASAAQRHAGLSSCRPPRRA